MRQIELPEVSLAVHDEGQGETLLLVHGFPLDHTMWRTQTESFRDSYRVIAPDLRGFGESGKTSGPLSMRQHADDLARLLDALDIGDPVHFCGLSMGGYIAWEFWQNYPARLRSLILCDTRAAGDTEQAAAGRREMAERVPHEGSEYVAEVMLPKLVAPRELEEDTPVARRIREMILKTDPETIVAAQQGMAGRADFRARLSEIQHPSLVVVGEQDAITPVDEMRGIAAALPNSRFVPLAEAGHMAPMEQPEAFNAALRDFLDELEPASG
ncbi:MAG: alpha/beta fold hydrolase [Planctomycetota bacterium]|nr:MAG: alpha/beta fold hydrolase [Planctomycetota bacterium]REK42444.1 MAG: alpha/beta fold hydrolase [Planctomycetota bacterium]